MYPKVPTTRVETCESLPAWILAKPKSETCIAKGMLILRSVVLLLLSQVM
jgi:hypothetical protein